MSSAGNPGFAGGWEGYSLIATALILYFVLACRSCGTGAPITAISKAVTPDFSVATLVSKMWTLSPISGGSRPEIGWGSGTSAGSLHVEVGAAQSAKKFHCQRSSSNSGISLIASVFRK